MLDNDDDDDDDDVDHKHHGTATLPPKKAEHHQHPADELKLSVKQKEVLEAILQRKSVFFTGAGIDRTD